MSKPRARRKSNRGYFERNVDTRNTLERFLIVCEGERTEPRYFKSFRVPKNVVEIYGLGYNTVALVERAIELSREGDYDQVWCVFDRNSFPAQNFNDAIALAQRNGVHVAYSNEAFELWYLLHFNYYDAAMRRSDCCTKLSELLGYKYRKNSDDLYEKLEYRQAVAIRNAMRLLAQYMPLIPERANPSTTVHLLVEQLNRFVR